MKKLSIITPAYKSERYLKTYFENITHQVGFKYYEVIVILNEPNNEEKNISDYFKNKFSDNIRLEIVPLESIAVSTNRGFSLADSEYITCADVDDIREFDSLSRQIHTLDQDNNVSYTYGDFIIVDKQGLKKGLKIKTPKFSKDEATRKSIIGPNHFFRKSILEKCGYWDEQLKSGADFDFQIRAAFNFEFKKTTGNPLLYYTRYKGSNSASSNQLQKIERTVIELRYGIYDKINYKFLPEALKYDIYHIHFNGQKKHLKELVPNYENIMIERYNKHFKKGILKNILPLESIEKIKVGFKYAIKNPKFLYNKIKNK